MQYIHTAGSNSHHIHYIQYKQTAIFREDVCTQWTSCGNHIQFLYNETDNKLQKQLPAFQTIPTDGSDTLGNSGVGLPINRPQSETHDNKPNLAGKQLLLVGEKAKQLSQLLELCYPSQVPKRGPGHYSLSVLTCVVCTCALKHIYGIHFPYGSLSIIDCTM